MATFSPPGRPLGDGVVSLGPWTEADLPALDAATRDPEIVRRNRLPRSFDAAAWLEQSNVEQERAGSVRLLIVDPTTDPPARCALVNRVPRRPDQRRAWPLDGCR